MPVETLSNVADFTRLVILFGMHMVLQNSDRLSSLSTNYVRMIDMEDIDAVPTS